MAGIALLSGPQDPSNLEAQLNSLITSMNAFLLGTSATLSQLSVVTSSSTGAVQANFGVLELNSTRAKTYKIAAPGVGSGIGAELIVFNNKKSTAGQGLTISSTNTSKFINNGTTSAQLTFKTKGQSVTLIGVASSRYLVSANIGSVTS